MNEGELAALLANKRDWERLPDSLHQRLLGLIDAGLLIKCCNVEAAKLSLAAYANHDCFKVFLLDCGLLAAMGDLDPLAFLQGQRLLQEFRGAFTENFVAQELFGRHQQAIYYWASGNRAEVDFVVEHGGRIFPLEVKAGIQLQSKSLAQFLKRFGHPVACRASAGIFARNPPYDDYPLYGLAAFPDLSQD